MTARHEKPRAVRVVEAESGDLIAYLGGLPQAMRAAGMFVAYDHRLARLHSEAAAARLSEYAATASVPCVGLCASSPWNNKLPAALLGELLSTFQQLYDAPGQAAAGRPPRRGVIPREIPDETRLMVASFSPGSFAVHMCAEGGTQVNVSPLGVRAFDALSALDEADARQDSLRPALDRFKGRVAGAYARFLDLSQRTNSDVEIHLAVPSTDGVTTRSIYMPVERARRIVPAIQQAASIQANVAEVHGILNAAHLRTCTFEIDLGEDGTLTGRADPSKVGLLEGLTLGRHYRFSLLETVAEDLMTGEIETSYLLVTVEPES